MFRFLVVEDHEPTLKEIRALLSAEFEGSSVDIASSVAEASQYLEVPFREGRTYDAALLDFKLPSASGENPEIDYSLCEEVRKKYPRTLVIHMTSYAMDSSVLQHLVDAYKELGKSQTLLVPKGNVRWPSILLAKLRTFLFSREVSRQMDELFGHEDANPSSPQPGSFRHPAQRGGGVTHRLAKLTQDIESHWQDLDSDLQRRIRDIFVVHGSADNIRVSLL